MYVIYDSDKVNFPAETAACEDLLRLSQSFWAKRISVDTFHNTQYGAMYHPQKQSKKPVWDEAAKRIPNPLSIHKNLSFFTFSFDSSYYAFVDNNNKTTTKGNADDRFILYLAKYYSPARPERWTWVNLSWYLIRSTKPNCGECIILFSRRTDQHNIINGLPPEMNLILQQPQPMV